MIVPNTVPPRETVRAGFLFALGVALLVVLALFARRFGEATLAVSTPFLIGGALALLLDPLVRKLTKGGMARMPATGLVFGLFLLILVGLGWLTIPALIGQASDLATNGPGYVATVQTNADKFLTAHPKIGPVKLPTNFAQLSGQLSARASGYLSEASGHLYGFLVGSVTLIIQMVLSLIIGFFLLVDLDRLRARLFFLAPERSRGAMGEMGRDVGGVFSDYLRGLLIVCALYGAFTIGLLYSLSILHHSLAHYALLVGAVAGVLYAVPYLGSAATAIVTFVVAFAAASADHQSGLAFGGIAVGATLALNQVFDNVVTPRVVGGGVGLHPVLALFALVMGGELFGLWGMLLSVPIAGSIQVILFRLYPRLTQPTPPMFLRSQGVPLESKESQNILHGDESVTAERMEAEK